MPVARIVARNVAQESPALQQLTERLRAAGYEIELAQPGTGAAGADLLIELDQLPAHQALDAAVQLARETDADLFVAPGVVASVVPSSGPGEHSQHEELDQRHPEPSGESGLETPTLRPPHPDSSRTFLGSTFEDLNAAVADSRAGIADSVLTARSRISGAWQQLQQRRADSALTRRLERERREIECDERRRQHQLELQRQAEQKQRLIAERERLAAERERVVREQMAREAALRAERERAEREAMAREAAHRAELAHAAEQERRRLAALETERLRVLREQEAARAAAVAAERIRLQREAEERLALQLAKESPAPPVIAEPVLDAAPPAPKPRLVRPPRRTPSPRERQWQRAAFIASLATLSAMIGYAIAANVHRSSALPPSLIQNGAEQQVPFGPAKMDVSSATKSAPGRSAPGPITTSGSPLSGPGLARPRGGVPSTSRKPSAAKPSPRHRSRISRSNDDIADEVIVHHAPTSRAQRAQSTTAVRRYSDDN